MTTSTKSSKTKNKSRNYSTIFQRVAETGGRFFGLYLSNGERINAQYRSQSEKYLVVFDRNKFKNRRILKTQVHTINT